MYNATEYILPLFGGSSKRKRELHSYIDPLFILQAMSASTQKGEKPYNMEGNASCMDFDNGVLFVKAALM